MKLYDYSILKDVRKFLENNLRKFPEDCSGEVTRFLNLTFGLEEIAGSYMNPESSNGFWHVWSLDPERRCYIDLTMREFSKNHKDVMILPVENKLIIPNESFTKSQKDYLEYDVEKLVEDFKEKIS